MIKTVFVTSTEPHSGKSIISIGLIDMLLGKAQKIGFFKPIISEEDPQKQDGHINTIINHLIL